jgi:hypothetical protein
MIPRIKIFSGLILGFGLTICQASAETVVYPTGVYPDDVLHIQAELYKSPEVLLKATNEKGKPTDFNFGPSGVSKTNTAFLVRDQKVKGETVHGRQTTIHGGYCQLACNQSFHIEIQGIHFDTPTGAAIFVSKTAGAKIWGNRITHVLSEPLRNFNWGRGIWVAGVKTGDVGGHVEISGNTVDDVGGETSYGIAVSNIDAEVSITDNVVGHVNLNGILSGGNTHGVWITRNRVAPGPGTHKDDSVGNGILVGHARGGTYHVIDNIVKCENPQADGLVFVGSGALPTTDSEFIGNDVTMTDSKSSAIGIYGQVSGVTVYGNRLRGSAAYAIQIVSPDHNHPTTAVANTIIGNQISGFRSSIVDLFLDSSASDTMAKGNGGTLQDQGERNTISGFQKKTETVKT